MINLYLDKRLELSNNQAITTGNVISENVIDFGVTNCSAAGKQIDIRVTEAFTAGTSVQFVLQDSSDNSTFTDKVTSTTYLTTALTLSKKEPLLSIAIPKGLRRYIRLKYVASGTFTAGKVHAILNTEVNV